jgi:hypothetical protein
LIVKKKKNWKFSLLTIGILLLAQSTQAALCKKWSAPTEIGNIPSSPISEQSGMAASKNFSRLYHNNDSGDVARIFVTDLTGKILFSSVYSDHFPLDVEELGYGPCASTGEKKCLYAGDIGDNFGFRPSLNFSVIEEVLDWPAKVKAIRNLHIKYPDGKHDAEAFSIHPNGDLFLITKAYSGSKALVASIFKLAAAKVFEGGAHVFEKVGEIDIPTLVKSNKSTNVATSMSISPDGSKFIVLTYNDVIEVNIDLSKASLPKNLKAETDFQIVKIKRLPQSEAVSYASDGKSFYYSSEAKSAYFATPEKMPLIQVRCISE